MPSEIRTEINIHAPVSKIWEILMDFEDYPNWNPFIPSIEGEKSTQSRLDVQIKPEKGLGMKIRPRVVTLEENKKFSWLGHLGLKGIFDGHHQFELKEEDGITTFTHKETFSGIMHKLILPFIRRSTTEGFHAMNNALKLEAEHNY